MHVLSGQYSFVLQDSPFVLKWIISLRRYEPEMLTEEKKARIAEKWAYYRECSSKKT